MKMGGGGGGGQGMAQLMRQANQMQLKMKKLQDDWALKTFDSAGGGGAVKVTVTGDQQLKAVLIDPELIKSGDAEMIQDLVIVAVNEAIKSAKDLYAQEMSKITGGMNIPGMF